MIFDDNCLNVSRHRPVLLNIVLPFSVEGNSLGEPSQYDDVMVNWRKSTEQGILKYTNCLLSDCELSDLEHSENLNSEYIIYAYALLSERIVRYAANSLPKKKYVNFLKPYWNSDLSAAHSNMRLVRRQWCNAG